MGHGAQVTLLDETESLVQTTLALLNENHHDPITSAENYKHASRVSVVYRSSSSANATTTVDHLATTQINK
jgi:hypothetical protein